MKAIDCGDLGLIREGDGATGRQATALGRSVPANWTPEWAAEKGLTVVDAEPEPTDDVVMSLDDLTDFLLGTIDSPGSTDTQKAAAIAARDHINSLGMISAEARALRAGVTSAELKALVHEAIESAGAIASKPGAKSSATKLIDTAFGDEG